jgi:GMP synthase (glutamine-hydrolysing)
MKIHVLQHVPFEDEAHIGVWADKNGCPVTRTAFHNNDPLPALDDIGLLVVMGGPMGVYDEKYFPWLADEKRCIAKALESGKKILGICLGAQLIASVMGARVYRNAHREIGWFPVRTLPGAGDGNPASLFPREFMAFHWHGDTFDIPAGSAHLAESDACPAQAFSHGGRLYGFQFHLESTARSIAGLLENCRGELAAGPFIQDEKSIAGSPELIAGANLLMEKVLDRLHRA